MSATGGEGSFGLLHVGFQYPLFGSSVCNPVVRITSPIVNSTFSILCSDRVSATAPRRAALAPRYKHFQYPLFGSSVCNPLYRYRLRSPAQAFQYPLFGSSVCNLSASSALPNMVETFSILCSDRVSATISVAPAGHRRPLLSVSSVRIECLQLLAEIKDMLQRQPFSILCSDRVSATS